MGTRTATTAGTPAVLLELTFDLIAPIFYGNSRQFILLGATYGGNLLYPLELYPLLGDPRVYDFYDPALNHVCPLPRTLNRTV